MSEQENGHDADTIERWKKHRNQINIELSHRLKNAKTETEILAVFKGFILDELAGARLVVETHNHRLEQLEGANNGHKNG